MPDFERLGQLRRRRPLVHCISNIVTANDCANLLLACGASPMMAEAPEEMEEITRIADATVLNLGTPSREKYAAARICLEQSKRSGKPVVLDPVGVGAGEWRLRNAASLLSAAPPDIVRVNLAEAEALLGLGGIAIVENAYDETYLVKGLSPEEIITEEPKLKELSYQTIAHLLFDKCDVLVVDKIGKNFSGDGMDPNVSGRFVQPKYCSGGIQAEKVVVLDLSDETHGNAQGIGLAEVTTRRLFNKMKLEMTYPTGVTNTFLHLMKIPMIMDNDREALQLALCCCPDAEDHDNMKMIRIPNTAHIDVIEISEGMLPLAKANPNIEILSDPYPLAFDENGNLF